MVRKILIPLLCCLLLLAVPTKAQTNCADYQLLRDNAAYELLTYDKKDRQTGRVMYNVKAINRTGGKVEATIHSRIFDDKGQLATEGDFVVGCEDGAIWMDMRSLLNPGMMESQNNMEMTMEGDKMLYPSNLQAGQKLEDGTMTMEMKDKSSGQSMMTMVMKVMNRTVEGKESIKVPAGTYDSYKIRQSTEMENRAMGMKMPGMRIETVEYYVPQIGSVRSETYRNGKLQSYTVLSKIE
ncbi:hypothetical protein POKO110462_01680 [Pontibacter korlensis]|uniref:DUF3108 domain-containing protein n=1 Tax=Pontibacter korlensis TaxID=400092 RepID=A0A0E3ZD30_9BACT|nr:hypothetical protein [Pontibacter korlensis]AKD02943.1 hypothetical protein PKOR_07155 [Pontibacter korlensis]